MLIAGDRSGYHGEVSPDRPRCRSALGARSPRGGRAARDVGAARSRLAGRVAQEVKIGGSANPLMVALMRGWLDASSRAAGRGTGAVRLAAGP